MKNLYRNSTLTNTVNHLAKLFNLMSHMGLIPHIRTGEMGKHSLNPKMPEPMNFFDLIQTFFPRKKTNTAHPRINFYMYIGNLTGLFCRCIKSLCHIQAVNRRCDLPLHHVRILCFTTVSEYQYRLLNTVSAQFNSFIRCGNSKPVKTHTIQLMGKDLCTMSVGIGLNDAHQHSGFRLTPLNSIYIIF